MAVKEKVGLDTGFFVKLLAGSPEAVELYNMIVNSEVIGVVPVLVTFELRRLALKGVINRKAYEVLEKSWKVLFQVEPVDLELALEAASVSHGTGLPAADAVIYTACKRAGCVSFYTTDADYEVVSKKRPRIIQLA